MPQPRIALLIDLDNAALAAEELDLKHCAGASLRISPLVEHIERTVGGTIEQRRAYGNVALHGGRALTCRVPDPRDIRALLALDADLQSQLAEHGFRVEHTPTRGGSGKNAADIALSLDAMEIAERCPHIDTIAVLSQDSDFAPLIQRLRARGREVVLVTVGKPSHAGMPALRNLSRWHVVYDHHLIDAAGFEHLDAVIEALRAESGSPLESGVPLDAVKEAMLARAPKFTRQALGFSSFRAFVAACVKAPLSVDDHGLLRLPKPRVAPAPQVVAPKPALVEADRAAVLAAELRKASLHPRTEQRDAIVAALRDLLAAGDCTEGPLTWRAALSLLLAQLGPQGVTRAAVGDTLFLLHRSGGLSVVATEGDGREALLVSLAEESALDAAIARAAHRTLTAAGVHLDAADAEPLATVLFGDRAQAVIEAVAEACGGERSAAK